MQGRPLKVHRNLDPALRPLQRAKEYKRALNAVKLDRLFAKPFLGAMEGHSDGVVSLAKSPTHLSVVLSGAADGEIRLWDVSSGTLCASYAAMQEPFEDYP